jgi:hypothetical protein
MGDGPVVDSWSSNPHGGGQTRGAFADMHPNVTCEHYHGK